MSETAFAPEAAFEAPKPYESALGAANDLLHPYIENQDVAHGLNELASAVETKHADELPGHGFVFSQERQDAREEAFGQTIATELDGMLVAAGVIRPQEKEGETWQDRLQQTLPDTSKVVEEINKLTEKFMPTFNDEDWMSFYSHLAAAQPSWRPYYGHKSSRSEPVPAPLRETRLDHPDAIEVEESQNRPALEAPADYEAPKTEVIIEPPKPATTTAEVLSGNPKVIDVESHEVPPQSQAA
jgi:hypothetical protein